MSRSSACGAAGSGSRSISARLVDGLEQGHRAAALPLLLERRLADARAEIVEVRRRVGPSELVVQPRPDDLAEQRRAGIQPKSERRASPSVAASLADISSAFASQTSGPRSRSIARASESEVARRSRRHPPRARATRGGRESARHPVRRPGFGGWRGSRRTAAWPVRDRRASTRCPRVTSATRRRSGHLRASVPGRRPPRSSARHRRAPRAPRDTRRLARATPTRCRDWLPHGQPRGPPGSAQGRNRSPRRRGLPNREARARSRPCGHRPSRRCTARLSSSIRRAVSRSP